jgi:hypothetical protein
MESSIAVFLLRQHACERLPTNDFATLTPKELDAEQQLRRTANTRPAQTQQDTRDTDQQPANLPG